MAPALLSAVSRRLTVKKHFRDWVATEGTLARVGSRASLARGVGVLGMMLVLGCAGSETKRAPSGGEGGAAGEEGGAAANAGNPSEAAPGGAVSSAGGSAGEGTLADAADPSEGGAGAAGSGGTANVSGAAGMVAGAGEGPTASAGAAGAESGLTIPVSICGEGKWFAGEGLCGECPEAGQVFELDCADYAGAQVLRGTTGQLQFAFASFPGGVQAFEATPVDVDVTYLKPNEVHLRVLRLTTSGWSVDLREAPEPPESLSIPPFSTADVCGNVLHSRQPIRFDREADPATTVYTKFCP
jgi:hypothetical protein